MVRETGSATTADGELGDSNEAPAFYTRVIDAPSRWAGSRLGWEVASIGDDRMGFNPLHGRIHWGV
jgi:hypothetical protein